MVNRTQLVVSGPSLRSSTHYTLPLEIPYLYGKHIKHTHRTWDYWRQTMSKVDESSWVSLTITLTPDDIMEVEDAIADLRWHGGTSSGILEHIVEQYKLKVEESKPNTLTPEDFEFIKEMVSLGKTSEGQRIMTTSSYFMNRMVDVHDKYGKQTVYKIIDQLKAHQAMHKAVQTSMEKQ